VLQELGKKAALTSVPPGSTDGNFTTHPIPQSINALVLQPPKVMWTKKSKWYQPSTTFVTLCRRKSFMKNGNNSMNTVLAP